ncbi:UDP-glucose 4-epimerase [Rhodococcus rhodochrous]|nr:UDP-glucose 4-epimerase [Rhodococcus rhodochrous]
MKVQFSTYRRSARTDSSQDRLLRPLTCHSPVADGLTKEDFTQRFTRLAHLRRLSDAGRLDPTLRPRPAGVSRE